MSGGTAWHSIEAQKTGADTGLIDLKVSLHPLSSVSLNLYPVEAEEAEVRKT